MQIFIFIMILILLVMPRHLLRLKHAAMAFLVYVFVRAPCTPALPSVWCSQSPTTRGSLTTGIQHHHLTCSMPSACPAVPLQVLTTLQVNSLFYFSRSPVSRVLFGSHRIKATLAGAAPPCGVMFVKEASCLQAVPPVAQRSGLPCSALAALCL
jgi:hypothetical protein